METVIIILRKFLCCCCSGEPENLTVLSHNKPRVTVSCSSCINGGKEESEKDIQEEEYQDANSVL